jgi:DNA-binding NtrC family response regulator
MAGFALTIEGNVELPSLKSRKALKFLQAYNWPANIHEWQNVITRAVIL